MHDDELRDVWSRYWEAYYADEGNARKVRTVATEYPLRRGLDVSYRDLIDVGMSEATVRLEPDRVLDSGVETFEAFVRGLDLEHTWERDFSVMILHLTDFPTGFRSFDYSNLIAYLNQLVQLEVTLDADPEPTSDLMEAAFVCMDGHTTRVHQPGRRLREIGFCPVDDCGKPVLLEEHDSLFAEILTCTGSGEGFSEVPMVMGGQRWKRAEMRGGDTFTVNGIPRAEFPGDSTHGTVRLDVLSMERSEDSSLF